MNKFEISLSTLSKYDKNNLHLACKTITCNGKYLMIYYLGIHDPSKKV